jgi:hypothetical protein
MKILLVNAVIKLWLMNYHMVEPVLFGVVIQKKC